MSNLTRAMMMGAAGAASGATYVDDVFSTYLFNGTGSALTIANGIDLAGEGGLVWIKDRDNGAKGHALFDTERGGAYKLQSQATGAQTNYNNIVFNSNGFTNDTVSDNNGSGTKFTSWTFRKAPGFFDVVTYTGSGTADRAIAHNLGSVPGMVIVKRTNGANNYFTYHRSLASPLTKWLSLNRTDGEQQANVGTNMWGSMTSTHIGVRDYFGLNAVGGTFVAYIFAHDDQSFGTGGDESIIKCGSYSGNDNAPHTIDVGFEPQFVMIKNIDNGANWIIADMMRTKNLKPNNAEVESHDGTITYAPRGFTINNNNIFSNALDDYIYMAIRRPNKPPEVATEVFAIDNQATGTKPPQYHSNFVVDMALEVAFGESSTYRNRRLYSRMMGDKFLKANLTSDQFGTNSEMFTWMDGFGNNNSSVSTSYAWMFKRAPGFFDVVAYSGSTTTTQNVAHSLGVVPEMMIIKNRDAATSWVVYHTVVGATKFIRLNTDQDPSSSGGLAWNDTAPTASVFTLGNNGWDGTNYNGHKFIAYLFATLPGISKVGSYTGTGSAINVDCGFTNGARFILIKRTASSSDWYVWDSLRGIVSGNDPYFIINSNAGDVTGTDYIDPLSSGFTVTSSAPAALNTNGGTYLFLAIA